MRHSPVAVIPPRSAEDFIFWAELLIGRRERKLTMAKRRYDVTVRIKAFDVLEKTVEATRPERHGISRAGSSKVCFLVEASSAAYSSVLCVRNEISG